VADGRDEEVQLGSEFARKKRGGEGQISRDFMKGKERLKAGFKAQRRVQEGAHNSAEKKDVIAEKRGTRVNSSLTEKGRFLYSFHLRD